VEGNNNIAQRNITIDDADDDDSDAFVGMIAGTRLAEGVATLLIDASALRGATSIRLHLASERAMKQLVAGGLRAGYAPYSPSGPGGKESCASVIVEQRTRLRLECGGCDVIIEAAPGTRILPAGDHGGEPLRTSWVRHHGVDALDIQGLRGRLEIPLRLGGGEFVPLLVAVMGGGTGELHLSQRRADGVISAGYGIRRSA
jgi:hypothetical protein